MFLPFQNAAPTPAGDWRHVVRFGLNVTSYKFALGQALLELAARQQTFVPLPELAVPYAAALCEHLQVEDRQSTAPQSRFLDACRSRNRGDPKSTPLTEATVRLGFANVIDASHISRGGQPTQTRFFVDERASYRCNSAKGARPPAADWMPWLDQRGEHLIPPWSPPDARAAVS